MAVNRELAADYLRRWGGLIFCKSCHRVSPVGEIETPRYMRTGWPTCCGETMVLIKKIDDPTLVDMNL